MVTVIFPKIFLCALEIITLLDPITYLYAITYLCGIICLKSKYLLPPYKLLRNYFYYCFISSCHYFTLVVLVCLKLLFYCGYASYKHHTSLLHIHCILQELLYTKKPNKTDNLAIKNWTYCVGVLLCPVILQPVPP